MRIAGSNRYFLNPSEKNTLFRMAKNVEEGGNSEDDSLEEITAEDFSHDARGSRSRVWIPDPMRYPISRNLASQLYSFAWAQAVQNKPLGFDVKQAVDPAEKTASLNTVKEEPCGVVIEDSSEELGGESEKEEGELEEGEIELDSEPMEIGMVGPSSDKSDMELQEKESGDEEPEEMGDFDKRVSLILEELEAVTGEEAETSFDAVCSRLRKSFESLKEMFSESRVPVLDALVQQAFMGIQTIHSALGLGNLKKKERNEDLLLRLLIHIKNQYSTLLTPEQIKEIDAMVQSIALDSKEKEKPKHGLVSSETANSVLVGKAGLPKIETHIAARSRVQFSPLLDLHTDYDEGSLPSPTRESAPPLPMPKPIGFGMGTIALTQPMPPKVVEAKDDTSHVLTQPMPPKNLEAKDDVLHLYDTDALKAVSSYQQKYSRNSFLASNRLPSPTPSEESDNNDDTHGEVSSSSVADNPSIVNPGSSLQLHGFISSGDRAAGSSGLQTAPVKTVGQLGSIQNSATKAPAKSRDPRLKFLNPEAGGSPDPNRRPMPVDTNTSGGLTGGLVSARKHKAVDDPVLDEHILKRQRNGFMGARDVQMTTPGRGGWLDESTVVTSQLSYPVRSNENVEVETRKPGNGEIVSNKTQDASTAFSGANGGIGQNPSSGADPAVLLPSLLKDIAVNPTMLMQLIKMEQQRLAAVSSGNGVSLKPPGIEQNPAGKSQLPLQTTSTNSPNDVGRLRMKPRDPRRFLHSNMLQKSESLKSEPTKVNGNLLSDAVSSKDRLVVREPGEQAQTTALPSHPTSQPDITRLFTTNLKNLADIVSSSRPTNASPAPPQNSSQLIPSMVNKVDVKPVVTDCNGEKTVSGLPCEGGTAEASQTPNPWGDVDHLLAGYDDQEIAAIQKERARRIDEQNKMFAARKLCLVLDLDHTLLNSAKFMEVDPIHDEILRKKEEQDREKPQRHLFRFQHMGMWTKLRPGIWNFLERASGLYELHLYTMGNKLYATEMAKVLDPTGALFAGRVISRGDDGDALDGDERVPKSKDLDGVLGMESAVVIIDDSVRVWPHNKLNLIVVERYTYFPYSRRQFGLLGPSLLEIDHDERPEEGTLASSLAVIERIHHNFFSHRSLNDIDVRNILAAEQRRILSGCRIVFSRIFPVGEANPHLHPLWQTAEQFGAVCTNQIDEQVTHVVANSLGTDKVNWALSTGRFAVQPGCLVQGQLVDGY